MRLKPKVKKAISTPAKRQSKSIIAQRELADRLAQCKDDELVDQLKSFTQWTFGEGDIHNWVDVLNRFDEFLSKLADHYEPQTTLDLPILKSSFPRETVLHVLRVTCLILENSFNRYLYGSAEHLGDLLRIDDPEIVLATLTLLSILVKKTRSRVTTRIHGDPILNAQLFYLTKGWGGKQDGLGLLYCVQDRDITPKLSVGTTLQFEFFVDPNEPEKPLPAGGASDSKKEDAMEVESVVTKTEDASAQDAAVSKKGEEASLAGEKAAQAGHRSIQFPCFHLFTESNIDILTQLVAKYSIPRKYHFPLLMRIRLARAFPDVQARRDLVRTNLLAFTVLAQAHMDLGTLSSFFLYEPEFIAELMELVKSDRHTPQDFRILALDALSALTTDRSRLPKVISATGSSQHHGELPSMVRKSVATLTGSVEHPIYTLPFIDSLFSFLAALMATPDGIAALNTAGIISTLLPLLRHQNLEHASILMQCLSILEYYVAGSNSAAAVSLFRDLGGLDLLIERFNTEIASVQKAKEQEGTNMSVEGVSEATDAKDKGKERVDTEPSAATDELQPSQDDDEEEESHLSHNQRTLVKTILRILLPFIQGGGRRNIGRLTGVIEGPFPHALRYVLNHYHYFGERIFSLAVSIMSGLINNDPTRFNALADAGLPRAFLTFVTQGVEPSSSVICALPSAISSLCLNPAGMASVVDANVIGALLSLFTTPKYRKVIKSGDTASRLGAGVDELLRHHPSLRPLGIKAMINALKRVCKMGGLTLPEEAEEVLREDDEDKDDEAKAEPSGAADVPAENASTPMAVEESGDRTAESAAGEVTQPVVAAETPQEVVATSASTSQSTESMELSSVKEEPVEEEPEQKVPPFVEPEVELELDSSLLSDYIGNLGRFLETIFTNSEHGRSFIDARGMELMLKLQSLPELPPTFPGSNAAHSLTLAFRSLAAHHIPTLFRGVLENMAAKFDSLDSLQPSWRDGSSFLEAEDNAKLVGVLASIDCFAGLLAGLVRDPSGLSRPGATSLGEWITDAGARVSSSLGHLQRCILWEIAREAQVERKKAGDQAAEASSEETPMTEAQPLSGDSSGNSESSSSSTAATLQQQPVEPPAGGEAETTTVATTTSGDEKKPDKKETKQLLIHLVSSIHSVSQGLAKALGARHRNRDEKVVHTLAQTLVRTLQEHLTWTPKAYTDDEGEAPIRCAYLTSVVGELRSFFFNERHNNTHTLLLHQFNYVDGVATFLKTLNWVVDIYVHLREKELEQQRSAKEGEATDKDKGKEKLGEAAKKSTAEGAPAPGDVTLGSIVNEQPSAPEAEKTNNRDPDMEMAESALLTFGTVLKYLVCGPMVATSPITANMMTQTLPGQQGSFDPHIFLGAIQSRVLLSVMPIWNHPLFAHFPQRFITSLIHANRYIMEGEAAAAAASAASAKPRAPPKAKKQFEPDPGVVTQLMEMGFSQRRAEDALRHIGANNVELAMDWIFTNPEPEPEPAPAVMPPAAPAPGEAPATAQAPTDDMAEAMSEDEELAAALAMSLGQSIEMPSSPAAASSSSAPPPPVKEEPAAAVVPEPKPAEEAPKKDEPVDYSKQYDILRKGMLERCVRLLTEVDNLTFTVVDVLSSICKKPDEKTAALTGAATKVDERVHVVEALADQIKLAAAERPPSRALYRLTHALTLLMIENTPIRELVANSDLVAVFLDLLELVLVDGETSKLTSVERDLGPDWLTTVLLALDTLCQLPSQLPASLATADSSASKSSVGDEFMAAESSGVDAGAKAASSKEDDAILPPMEVPYLLSLPDRKRAMEACVGLLQRPLHPDPLQALLQLSSHLTRDFELAQQFLHQGGLTALLTLAPTSSFSGQVSLITTILRHLIEEPSLLQHAMESEIKSTITKLMGRSGALVKPKNFLSTVAPLVCRDPVTFLRASANVCRLRDPKPSVSPARVVLCLANPAPPAKGKGPLQASSGIGAKKTDLSASSGKAKAKRTTPATSVQVITELTNALLTLSRIKKAVDLKPTPKPEESEKGKEKSDANLGQESTNAMDTAEAESSLMDVPKRPTLSSGEILQILTDFITTYPPCGSVLLRQQLKKTGAKGKGKEKKDKEALSASKRQMPETNSIISYVLSELLPHSPDANTRTPVSSDRQKANAAAANMLAALAQKPEGRRRVIDEITQAMRKVIADRDQYTNYPEVIQALVDFLYMLLTSSASRTHASGFLGEVARLMLDVDTIKTLSAALNSADLNHPDAPQLVNSILKPLEILTRLTAVMSAKSSAAEKKSGEGEVSADAAPASASSSSSSSSSSAPEPTPAEGAGTAGESQQASEEGDQPQLDTSTEQPEQNDAARAGDMEEEEDTRSGDSFLQSHAANLSEAIQALSGQGQQLSNVVNMTLNFIEAANEAMQARAHSVSDMDEDLSDSSSESESESESDLSDEEREEGGAALHHHPEEEDEEEEEEEGEEGVEEEDEDSSSAEEDEEGGEDAYSYEEPEDQQDWGGQGDFDFSIQIGNQAATTGRQWALNVEDLLLSGAPLRDVSLPRAVPPPNPFLAESVESAHPLLGARAGAPGGGLQGGDMGVDASFYPLPPSLRGNPVVEDEVRRLFGRVRAQRTGRPGQFGEEGHRTTPGMAEYAASIEPLFVETIRRVTLQELKEKEDAERAEQEKVERERAEKDEGASKGAEEKADEEPAAAPPMEVPVPATTEPTEPTATVPPATEDVAQTAPAPVEAVPADAAEPMQTSETTTAPAEGETQPAGVQPVTEPTAPASEAAVAPAVSSTEPVQQSTEPAETAQVSTEGAPTPQAEQTTTPPAEVGDDLGIDPAFLAALPEDLRAEILAEQLHARSVAAASRLPQPAAAPTAPATIATPSAPATPAPAPASSSSSSPSSSSSSSSSAPATGAPGTEPSVPAVSTTSISPDFIAALPPEIQAEVLQQEQQSQAAAAAAAADLNRAQAMTTADFFATLSPDLREEILLTQDEASLPPELAAEASALRERALRQYQQYSNRRRDDGGWGGPVFGGPRRVPVAPAEPSVALGLASRVKAIKGGDIQPLELEGRPIIEPSELVHLVRLLYLAKPLAKGLLHRLFLNLSTHKESRMQLLNIMMTILDAFATSTQTSSSAASACLTRRFASFAEALEALPAVTPSSSFSPLEEPCHPLLSAGTMNTYAHSGQHPPSLVARRVLEILCHLLKHNPRIASFVLGSNDDIEESSAAVEAKGKEKETDLTTTTTSTSSSSTSPTKWCPLARLMDLLGVDQFRNSSAQLDQLLQLLALSVQPLAKLKAREERRKREIEEREARERAEQERRERERLRLELEAAEQAMTEEAALAAATAASTEDMQAAAASAAHAQTEEGQQQQQDAAPATMEVEAPTAAPTPAEAAQEMVVPVAPARTEEQPAAATPAEAGMEVDTPATTGSRTPAAEEEKKEEEKEPRERTAEEVCPQVPVEDLRNLVSILTLENCSEGTYKNATHVLQQLSANALNREVLFKELISAAEGLAQVVVNGLDGLCEELASSFHPTLILSMASSIAELNLLRIIKTVMALPATPAQTTDDFIDSLRLEPLWDALERCLDIITESMEKDAATKGKSKAGDAKGKERDTGDAERDANKSPAANLLLPIIEVFFVVNAKDPGPLKRSASVIDFGGAPAVPGVPRSGSSTSLLRSSASRENLTRSMSRSGSLYNLSEQQSRFAMFAEKHRGLLNDLVRQNPALLHGTFKVLLKYPRVLDFDNKRAWFRHQLQKLKDTRGYYGGVRLRINRAKVFEDSYRIMSGRTPEELRGRMTVQFQGEEGIDAGGLTREWYDILAKEVFNADYALFINTAQDNSTFQPNRFSYYNPNHLDYFKFVGRVIGKAILDGYFLPCHFTRSFYKHILGITVQPSDMEAIDPEYYKNLRWILENDPTPLDLTFSSEVDEFGKMRVVDLKEDGKNIAVTNENKHEYVQLVTEMRMTTSIKSQIDAFLGGFHDLIPQDLISVFNEMELELLISGLPEIDLDDLRANTLYTGFSESSPVIQWFWKIVNSFGQEERAKLLQFVTGTSRVPLDGFKSLRGISGPQKFQIHKSYRKDQLPAAHTCFNQLDLPEYDNYERLREALMYAIRETEGFGFG